MVDLLSLAQRFPKGSINVFDRDLRYMFAAGEGLVTVGLYPDHLIGRTIYELFPDGAALVQPFYQRAFEGESVRFELKVFGRVYNMSAGPMSDAPVEAIIVVAQDVTAN